MGWPTVNMSIATTCFRDLPLTMTDAPAIPNITSSDTFQPRLVDSVSPYSHLLGTTVAFSERPEDLAFKAELSAFIGVVDSEISECRQRVDALKAALATAKQDLAAAKAFRDLHASIFPGPINTLPPEVLTKIFKMVVGCDLTRLRESPRVGPWVLRNVCTYWRNIAESEPRLWCSFDLSLEPGKPTTKELSPHRAYRVFDGLLTNTLRWSGLQELDFIVDLRLFLFSSPNSSANTSITLPQSLKELFANSARWGSVILFNIGWVLSSASPVELGDLNHLKSLTLQEIWGTAHGADEVSSHDYDPVALAQFSRTPQLRFLRLTVPSKPLVLDNFRWSQLDHLFLDLAIAEGPLVLVTYCFIAMCPQLTHYYDVNGPGFERSRSCLMSKPTIILSHLQHLRLSAIDVLFRLQCPQLNRLILPALDSSEATNLVIDFLRRSSSQSLERVHLRVANQATARCPLEVVLHMLKCLCSNLFVVPQLRCIDLMLDLKYAKLSKHSAVELLRHLYTTARSNGSAGRREAPIYDAGPNSPLHGFLTVFREAHVPDLKITINLNLKVSGS
ncbi:hypothetical protein CPB85DRAFT_1280329 [Mucidula mucida]|nr:hypothetical protein CPB85DRAFT_1280329 [Mucidula mucida]